MANQFSGFYYSTKQSPAIGDIVKVASNNGLNYYSAFIFQKPAGTKYRVSSIRKSSVSTVLRLTDLNGKSVGNEVCAAHFELVGSVNKEIASDDQQFMVVNMVTGSVIKTASDEAKITEFMKKKIEDNYRQRLGLYSLVGVAAAEKPKVVFTRPGKLSGKKTESIPNTNSPDEFFKKV